MYDEQALDAVRVTAQRVQRSAEYVEGEPSDPEVRGLWRAAMSDFRRAVREARAAGCDTATVQEVAGQLWTPRFVREGAEEPRSASPR